MMKKDYMEESMQDALIKYAASKYVEKEGEKILDEAEKLNQSDEFNLTEEQKKQFEELCKKELKKNKRKSKNYKMIFYRVAAAIGIVLLGFNISVVSVPAMRQKTLGFLTKKYDTHTTVEQYPEETPNPIQNVSDDRFEIVLSEEYTITYLPEGFKIGSLSKSDNGWNADYYNQDAVISFSQMPVDGTSIGVDTEHAKTKTIYVEGEEALLSVKPKDKTVTITWRSGNCFLQLASVNVDEEEMINVAESVKKVK